MVSTVSLLFMLSVQVVKLKSRLPRSEHTKRCDCVSLLVPKLVHIQGSGNRIGLAGGPAVPGFNSQTAS
jgi:uncharacterized protein YhhL (DUF1145 family)